MNFPNPILLFDGECNLCNRSIQFVLKRDRQARFRFASLQSEVGQSLLKAHDMPMDLSTVVLIEGEQAWIRSDAALRVLRHCGRLWPLLYPFVIVPRPLRDLVYRFIAHNRIRWFGKSATCTMPEPDWASRFLAGKEKAVAVSKVH